MFSQAQRLENYKKLAGTDDAGLAKRFAVTRAAIWFWLNGRPMTRMHKQRLVELELEYLVSDRSPLSPEAKGMIRDGYARAQ